MSQQNQERYQARLMISDHSDSQFVVYDTLIELPVLDGFDSKTAAQISADTFNNRENHRIQALVEGERAVRRELANELRELCIDHYGNYRDVPRDAAEHLANRLEAPIDTTKPTDGSEE